MKNIGIIAMMVGIVVLVLGLFGMSGGGSGVRTLLAAAVIFVAAGLILYSRGRRRISA